MLSLRRHLLALFACLTVGGALLAPAGALAATGSGGLTSGSSSSSDEGGASNTSSAPVRTAKARIVNGQAVAPASAPQEVKAAIAAANAISAMPYRYGGGHASFEDTGYDCSGAMSYALRGAGLLNAPLASGPFMIWGAPGRGDWITTYANGGHAFVMIAGLRFDTGFRDARQKAQGITAGTGPRWGYARATAGFTPRHPAGL